MICSRKLLCVELYRFFTPPLAGIGKLLALFGRYFGIGITVHVIFLSFGYH
jgi:hypothetical protein